MMNKRTFLKRVGQMAMATPFLPYDLRAVEMNTDPYPSGDDNEFWMRIRKDYSLKPDYINLENGYYCICPGPTLQKFISPEQLNLIIAD